MPGAPAWVGDRLLTVADREDTRRVCLDGEPVTPVGVQVRRVIDIVGDDVYVAATTDPTEVHVARCGADGDFRWLTQEPGVHGAAFGGATRVETFTTIGAPGRVHVQTTSDPITIASFAEAPVVDPKPELHVVGDRELRVALLQS